MAFATMMVCWAVGALIQTRPFKPTATSNEMTFPSALSTGQSGAKSLVMCVCVCVCVCGCVCVCVCVCHCMYRRASPVVHANM